MSSLARQYLDSVSSESTTLSPVERTTQIVTHAQHAPISYRQQLIAELERGSGHDQHIATLIACTTLDTQWIRTHLAHPVPHIQLAALRAASSAHNVSDDEVQRAIEADSSYVTRKHLLKVGLVGRSQLSTTILPRIQTTWGPTWALYVLVHCPEQVVAQHLAVLMFAARVSHWRTLARAHPDAVMDTLVQDLQRTLSVGLLAHTWWEQYGSAVAVFLKVVQAPELIRRVLDLIDLSALDRWPNSLSQSFAPLVRVDPQRVAGYCTQGLFTLAHLEEGVGHRVRKRWVRALLGTPHLVALTRHLVAQNSLGTILSYLPWSARGQLYKLVYPTHPQLVHHAKALIDNLPQDVSAELATHMLQVQADAEPQERFRWYAYLPTQDPSAQQAIQSALRKSDANDRLEGYRSWITQVVRERNPKRLAQTMDQLATRIRNEQQPVREPVLVYLTELPVQLWSTAALPALYRMTQDALEAPDSSGWVVNELSNLATRIFSAHAQQGESEVVQWTKRMLELVGPNYYSLDEPLNKKQVKLLWSLIQPRLMAGIANKVDISDDHDWDQGANDEFDEHSENDDSNERGHSRDSNQEDEECYDKQTWRLILDFCSSYGHRALSIPEVASFVRHSARRTNSYARQFRQLYLKPRATRLERTKEILALDRSVASMPLVANVVVRHLPQECTELLSHDSSGGKATVDGTPCILRCDVQYLYLLSPKLNQLYLDQVEQALNRAPLHLNFERRGLVRRLAHVPGGPALAAKWLDQGADLGTRQVEQALTTLGSDPNQLDRLLGYASDHAARVAMGSAQHAASYVCASRVQVALTRVLRPEAKAKLISQKAVVEALARLVPVPDCARIFANLFEKGNLHRDVLTALISCTVRYLLSVPTGWEILHQVVTPLAEEQGQDFGALDYSAQERIEDRNVVRNQLLRESVCTLPWEQRRAYAELVVQLVPLPDPHFAQRVLERLPDWAVFHSSAYDVLIDAATDLEVRSSIWSTAIGSIASLVHLDQGRHTLNHALIKLLQVPNTTTQDTKQDLSAVRRVEALLHLMRKRVSQPRYLRAGWVCVATVLTQEQVDHDWMVYALVCDMLDLQQLTDSISPSEESLATLAHRVAQGQTPHTWSLLQSLANELSPVPTLVPKVLAALEQRIINSQQQAGWTASREMAQYVQQFSRGSTVAALIGTSLAKQLGFRADWTEPWQGLVRSLRLHSAPDVRLAARRIDLSIQAD